MLEDLDTVGTQKPFFRFRLEALAVERLAGLFERLKLLVKLACSCAPLGRLCAMQAVCFAACVLTLVFGTTVASGREPSQGQAGAANIALHGPLNHKVSLQANMVVPCSSEAGSVLEAAHGCLAAGQASLGALA